MARVGELDQRIKIRREAEVSDGLGGQTLTVSTLAEVWAHVRPATGSERAIFERLDAQATYVFTIRNRPDITIEHNDRIEWDGVDYNIRFPAYPGKREMYFEITAERGVAQ